MTASTSLERRRVLAAELATLAASGDRTDTVHEKARDAALARVARAREDLSAAEHDLARLVGGAVATTREREDRLAAIRSELHALAPEPLLVALGSLRVHGAGDARPEVRRAAENEIESALLLPLDAAEVRALLARVAAKVPGAYIRIPEEVKS